MDKIALVKALLCEGESGCGATTDGSFTGGSKIKIVILQRGWVFIGKFSQNGSMCKLSDAHCIRTWGTTKGLGELAEDGVQTNTKLDKVNDVQFHTLTSIAIIDCNDSVWKKVI